VTQTGELLSDPKTAGPLIGVVNLPYSVCTSFDQTEEAALVDGDADLPYAAGTDTKCSTTGCSAPSPTKRNGGV
jgi:hypothetical protein